MVIHTTVVVITAHKSVIYYYRLFLIYIYIIIIIIDIIIMEVLDHYVTFGKGFLAGVIVVLLQTLLTRTLEFIYNYHLTKPCINEVSFLRLL